MTKATYTIKPGQYLVIPEHTCKGGVTYGRKKDNKRKKGDGYSQDIHSRKTVDHEEIIDRSDKIREAARYILRVCAVKTAIGWIADSDGLRRIRDGFTARGVDGERHYPGYVTLAQRAADCNRDARRLGSERRVHVDFVELDIRVDNERAAKAIARTVRETCEELLTACKAGDAKGAQTVLNRTKNLEKLAVGFQRQSIVFAIDCAKDCIGQLKKAIKGEPKSQHERLLKKAAKSLDVDAIEACLGNFADWDLDADGLAA
jgi:hypothetical protein